MDALLCLSPFLLIFSGIGADIFARGCCLPSDNKMTSEQQDRVIELIKACFE